MMPHPERVFRTVQMSWHLENWGEDSPWIRMFRNARRWVGSAFRELTRATAAASVAFKLDQTARGFG